jgi:hypothetical protein
VVALFSLTRPGAVPVTVPTYLLGVLSFTVVFGFLGAGIALVVSLPLALLDVVSRPLPVDRLPDPVAALRLDRRWSTARAAVFGIVVGTVLISSVIALAATAMRLFGRATGTAIPANAAMALWPPNAYNAIVVGVVAAVGMLVTHTAWGRYTFARAYLALTRRAPWRLMAFLADARERGVLRRVGAAYAFRHESLQKRLTRRAPATTAVPTAGTPTG